MIFSNIIDGANKTSPYKICLNKEGHHGVFETDNGVVYNLSLIKVPDIPIEEAYYIVLERVNKEKGKHDPKIGETVTTVIVSCIDCVENIIIFTCDNSDKKQEARNILFKKWFYKYIKKEYFRYDKEPDETFDKVYVSFVCDINNPKKMNMSLFLTRIFNPAL